MRWKWLNDIHGLEGYERYKVYEDGTVKSNRRKNEKTLTQHKNHKGYMTVTIYPKKTFSVHRLVALAFVENENNKPQVNHKDGEKLNNHFSNLEWATGSENIIHANALGLTNLHEKELNYQYDKEHENCKKVMQLSLKGEEIATFFSIAMAARSINKSPSSISKVCAGKAEIAHGFKWKFIK